MTGFVLQGEECYPIYHSSRGEDPMRLNPPKKITFWTAVIIAAVGVVVYVVHLFAQSIPYMQPVAFLLVVVAFVLLCLGLTVKGL
jgi:hypothetical protein